MTTLKSAKTAESLSIQNKRASAPQFKRHQPNPTHGLDQTVSRPLANHDNSFLALALGLIARFLEQKACSHQTTLTRHSQGKTEAVVTPEKLPNTAKIDQIVQETGRTSSKNQVLSLSSRTKNLKSSNHTKSYGVKTPNRFGPPTQGCSKESSPSVLNTDLMIRDNGWTLLTAE